MTFSKTALMAILPVVLLAGCNTNPARNTNPNSSADFQRPASERPVTTRNQRSAKVHTDLGMAYYSAGRFGVGLDEARVALAYDPNYAPAHHLNALLLVSLGDKVAAQQAFEQAIRLAPGDPEINNSYGWYLCVEKRYNEGMERLAMASRNPYYDAVTRPLTNSGLCLMLQQKYAEAEPFLKRAVAADPNNTQALLNLAAAAFFRENYEAAHAYLNSAHQQGAVSAESLWLGVRIERKRGDKDSEATYASQLKSRFPTSREYQQMIEGKYE
ncbi:type IV pilus biogenesis/stability protein PilW [Nitrogeniibacter aestuarii]|uniref:type IV pilus biogenesis/stability protein PilW n=1 Tax=Nitrogeniibacter aestuarii TaxID=2815343 RepID=UPI001D101FD6|nr:type IV pilus biogenesis/stability protein PilW [Nitrogeniibacter aestuarii]